MLKESSGRLHSWNNTGMNYIFLLIYLGALSALGSFVNDLYLPSLPEIMKVFRISVSTDQLGLTMGMAGLGIGQVILGPLSDMYGRKPVLKWATLLLLAGCIACVFSPTIEFFLLCRLIQGFGASAGYFLGRTIPTDIYRGRDLAKVMAIIGAINGLAPASAPVIGGILGTHFGWRGSFVFLCLCAVLILLFLPKLKETLSPEDKVSGRYLQAFASYGTLIKNRPFFIHCLFKGLALGILFAYIASAPFIYEEHHGWTQTAFGIFMGINSLAIMTGAFVALKFSPLKKGLFVAAWIVFLVSVIQSVALFVLNYFWIMEFLWLPILLGLGIVFNTADTIAMNEGRNNAGNASALIGVVGYVFGAVVSPLVGEANILHSTGIALVILSSLMLIVSYKARLLPVDLQNNK